MLGRKKCKPYFNQDCYLRRKEYRKCRNLHWRIQRVETKENLVVRDRPFSLKGGGGLWFFVSFRIFFSDNTRVRIFMLSVAQSANFFPRI